MATEPGLVPSGPQSRRRGWAFRPAARFVLTLVPIVGLAAIMIVRPLSIQGAPPAPPSPVEVVSDAPVCVRYYPATNETREGPDICTTRAGDPPPPAESSSGTTSGSTDPVLER